MREAVITGGARTAVGRLLGSLKRLHRPPQLGGIVIKAALERAGLAGDQVDYVIMGQVLQAGAGQIPGPAGRGGRRDPDDRCRRSRSTRCACPGWTRSRSPRS